MLWKFGFEAFFFRVSVPVDPLFVQVGKGFSL